MTAGSAFFQQHPALRLLEQVPVSEVDLSGLDEVTRERILRASRKRKRPLTVGRTMRTLSVADRERLMAWLYVMAVEPNALLRPAGPHAGMSRKALEAWAEESGVRWAIEFPLRDPHGAVLPVTVADVVTHIAVGPKPWWFYPELQERCLNLLESAAKDAVRAREWLETNLETWRRAPSEPVLRPLWKAAFSRLSELMKQGRPSSLASSLELVIDQPPYLRIEVVGALEEINIEGEFHLPADHRLAMACAMAILETVHNPDPELLEALRCPAWERNLHVLDELTAIEPLPESEDKPLLGWEVAEGGRIVDPVQCRWTRTGRLQCRKVEVESLHPALLVEPVDQQVAAVLANSFGQPSSQACKAALSLLAGHPRVVHRVDKSRERIEVRSGQLCLRIEPGPSGSLVTCFVAGGCVLESENLALRLHRYQQGDRIIVEQDNQLIVVQCTPAQRDLADEWLRRDGTFPEEALRPLLKRLPSIQRVIPVQLAEALRGEVVAGDERPLFRASFRESGLVVEARIQPIPDVPSFGPGEGPDTLHVTRSGKPACVVRQRAQEPAMVRGLAQSLGLRDAVQQRPFVWAIDDLSAALDVVRALGDGQHRLEVDGSLPQVALGTTNRLSLDVASKQDWFAVGGQLKTELGDISLEQLMAAVDDGLDYVQVSKNVYVRLEDALSNQLSALGEQRQGGGMALNLVHAPLLQGLEAAGATVQGGASWRDLMDCIERAATLEAEVPAGLKASLRSYQLAGFRWLASLASWAPGAILADDMGLGKTVQAIALLLRRGAEGPALVVAPTSVVFNWQAELARFAPSLRVVCYAGAQRAAQLEDLGANTVVLCSWGILQRDEALGGVSWATTVLDEAQAIKNPASKRAKAAVGLDSSFRLALSGTPVENRVEELWSVFSATVPGLLGPLAAFRERYGSGLPNARRALARLVAPFLLRRTKREVATDLPPRTELRETIELNREHRALYLRARAEALVRIERAPPAKRRFLLLSQLTRLRQLACDPRLVDASSRVHGGKVERLLERLRDVKQSGEQALVFSSFVGHLELAREACEVAGLRVAWLTGAVPADRRQTEVARFQAGEADVFLISLKAGGTGLNLTAASYVFHLDPWWNPAAEDQATDRAHRIGQTQPVTVYRLVAAGTIEDQILALHDDKRDLVEALMAGSGSSVPVSADELMALLADPMATGGEQEAGAQEVGAQEAAAESEAVAEEGLPGFLVAAAALLERSELSEGSRRGYQRALEQFVAWCEPMGIGVADLPRAAQDYIERAQRGELPVSRGTKLSAVWGRVGHLSRPAGHLLRE